jgi:hypothetical protein
VLDTSRAEAGFHLITLAVLPAGESGSGMDAEPENARLVTTNTLLGDQGRIHLEENIMERSSEICSVDRGMARRLGIVDILALGAIELHGLDVGEVRKTHGEERVLLAHDTRALSEVAFLVLIKLDSQKTRVRFYPYNPLKRRKWVYYLTIFARPLVVTMYLACTKP